jgi:tetratricopeptide (TPR) repeat protein
MTNPTLSDKEHWRDVYLRQRLKNAHLWLEELEKADDPVALAAANYDKLLQAIEQTLKHEDTFSVGCDLLREITPIAFAMADWGRLLIYLKGALSKVRRLSNRSLEAYLHEWIADIESSLNNLLEAERHFHTALQLYLQEGETVRYGRILPRLARVHISRGQLSKATDLCQDALKLGEIGKETIIIADALFSLGEIHIRSNDWEQALNYCERATAEYKRIAKQSHVLRTKVLAVICHVYLGRYDTAKTAADLLLQAFETSDNVYDNIYDSIHLRNVIALMAFKQEDYHSAEKHWQEAYHQNTMVGAPDLTASIGNNLGKVYTKMGEYEAAEEILADSLVLFNQLGDVPRWANCMDNLADLYQEMGDNPACERTLVQAVTRLEPEATSPYSEKLLHMMQQRLQKLQAN